MEVFASFSGFETTAMPLTSLEVAEAVNTPKIGRALSTSLPSKKSQGSPS